MGSRGQLPCFTTKLKIAVDDIPATRQCWEFRVSLLLSSRQKGKDRLTFEVAALWSIHSPRATNWVSRPRLFFIDPARLKAFIPELAVASAQRKGEGLGPQWLKNWRPTMSTESTLNFVVVLYWLSTHFLWLEKFNLDHKISQDMQLWFKSIFPIFSPSLSRSSFTTSCRGVQMKVVVRGRSRQRGQQRHYWRPLRQPKVRTWLFGVDFSANFWCI